MESRYFLIAFLDTSSCCSRTTTNVAYFLLFNPIYQTILHNKNEFNPQTYNFRRRYNDDDAMVVVMMVYRN